MLTVRTYLDRSPIHGVGVFAAEPIAAGAIIWEADYSVDKEFTRAEFDAFPTNARLWIAPYMFATKEGMLFFCGDNARFMNHASDANIIDVGENSVAAREIAVGEELTYDYRATRAQGLGTSDSFLGPDWTEQPVACARGRSL